MGMYFRQKTKPNLACLEIPEVLQVPPYPVTRRIDLHNLAKKAGELCLLACNMMWKYFEQGNVVHKH